MEEEDRCDEGEGEDDDDKGVTRADKARRKGREKGRREKGRREKGRSVPASRGIIDDVYDARKVRGSTYTFRPPSPSPVESFSIV
jgi:hypothetical protein